MRADADFMVYVGARWPALVRDAVLLGCPPEQAAEATIDALSRCRRGWGRASRDEDVDLLVRGELVAATARRPRTPEGTRQQAADELLVLAPPALDDLRHQEQLNRRLLLKRAATYAVPLLLVGAGAGVYFATTGSAEPEPPAKKEEVLRQAAVVREENPAASVVWYADGQLHLAHTVLAVEGLRDMTRIGAGVVYGDEKGRVVYAADDGRLEVLGHKDPDVPVAATDETGLAAWYDPDSEEVLVVEAATGHVRVRTGVDDEPEVVAVDGDVTYLVGKDGTRGLLPTGPSSEIRVSPAGLLDVRSRVRAFQLDPETIQVVQSPFDVSFALSGLGASLSPDGDFVGTRLPRADFEVAVYDTRSGEEIVNGLSDDDHALAFALGDAGTISYVMAPNGLTPGRELQLRTCELATAFCRIVARIPNTGGTPVLAR